MKFLKKIPHKKNQNLVIIRCGANSLHNEFLYKGNNDESWDKMLLSYIPPSETDLNLSDYVVKGGLSKWTDINDLLNEKFFDEYKYEYVMIADDDILPTKENDINHIFEYARKFNFDICQPSLTHDSFCYWDITLRSPSFHVRFTNFVECMMPVFSLSSLKKLRFEISQAVSGCGLDLIFSEHFYKSGSLGIIDDISFKHTKPIDIKNGVFYKHLRDHGIDPVAETKAFLDRHNLMTKEILTLGGIVKKGIAGITH